MLLIARGGAWNAVLAEVATSMRSRPSLHPDPDQGSEATTLAAAADPAERARTAVIAQVAVFEAVNSIVGDCAPYHRKLHARTGAYRACERR